ncbi:MAG: terminase TerL endonuclease subunit [Rhodoglobus sp.]
MGHPYMPWQQYVADVTGEVNPKTGRRIYREILLTISRQEGKTTVVRVKKVHRALDHQNDPQLILFAAQDGIEAKKKWLQHAKAIQKSPLGRRLVTNSPSTSNGKEVLEWDTGSSEYPIASTAFSGHGDTLDFGVLTEAFAARDYRVEETMLPAMLARPDAQFLAESTAGNATSIYWNERIAVERERLTQEPTAPSRVAFFDWSADPDQDDPADPATWRKVSPALGWTIQFEEIEHAFHTAVTPARMRLFKRGYLNITDIADAGESIFDALDWEATGSDASVLAGPRAFALDITNDRTWSAISWAGTNLEGLLHHEVIQHERGTHWVIPYLVDKMRRNQQSTVTVIAGQQAALMEDDLRAAGLEVRLLSRAEYAAACASYHDGIADRSARHLSTGQTDLDTAAAGAAWTTKGEQRVFSRSNSTTDISPLISCAVAGEAFRIQVANDYDVLDSVG